MIELPRGEVGRRGDGLSATMPSPGSSATWMTARSGRRSMYARSSSSLNGVSSSVGDPSRIASLMTRATPAASSDVAR